MKKFLIWLWANLRRLGRAVLNRIQNRLPVAEPAPTPAPPPTPAPVPFEVEIKLLSGTHRAPSQDVSVLFYTIPKCASVFAWNIMARVASEHKLTPVDFGGYSFPYSVPKETIDLINAQSSDLFREKGYLFGPFRDCLPVPREWSSPSIRDDIGIWDLSRFKTILMVRDPRDVLVSLYYSQAYSHSMPAHNEQLKAQLTEQREKVLEQRVDDFVLEWAPRFTARYRAYCRRLLNQPQTLLLKYEDMVVDFPAWLDRLDDFLGYKTSWATRQSLLKEGQFTVDEDVMSHRRQVTPGDHIRKLSQSTITELDNIFRDTLDALEYAISAV